MRLQRNGRREVFDGHRVLRCYLVMVSSVADCGSTYRCLSRRRELVAGILGPVDGLKGKAIEPHPIWYPTDVQT